MACHNNRSVVLSYVVSTEYRHYPQQSKTKATYVQYVACGALHINWILHTIQSDRKVTKYFLVWT